MVRFHRGQDCNLVSKFFEMFQRPVFTNNDQTGTVGDDLIFTCLLVKHNKEQDDKNIKHPTNKLTAQKEIRTECCGGFRISLIRKGDNPTESRQPIT